MSILLIDSYDSFTYNLKDLIEKATNLQVITIHNDLLSISQLKPYLKLFKAVIIGPGPGNPNNEKDVGVIPDLFKYSTDAGLPILGICLGFQSLGLFEGSKVERLNDIKHGQVYPVIHNDSDLFKNIPNGFKSVRYHSLHVNDLGEKLEKLAITKDGDEEIVMAMKHVEHPWFGVQYHPESVCSEYGEEMIKNFMTIVVDDDKCIDVDDELLSELINSVKVSPLLNIETRDLDISIQKFETEKNVLELCDLLHDQNKEFILLNSASNPGNWSIIGLPNQESLYITHSTEKNNIVELKKGNKVDTVEIESIWRFISSMMEPYISKTEKYKEFPFIGGLMGLFSYEEGDHINLTNLTSFTKDPIPDTKLVFIEDVILRNNSTKETFIISKCSADNLKSLLFKNHSYSHPSTSIPIRSITYPDESDYKSNFQKCQDFLHSGDSYELCLTTNTKFSISSDIKPWDIYKTLTLKNPSPYSAYFNFDSCVLLSSSPERFVSWDNDYCELRPIKGTVRKTPEMTFEKATEILKTPKEIGENLMIVDLIRHDLYQLLEKVKVEKLMNVEEYSTVYQLVSVIQGYFTNEFTGIDILSRSLPPGSMTGAPKKRSVEFLQELEGRRGIYSGICGYWSIDNKADWSVIIRSVFHYVHDLENTDDLNVWRIGAGGAITVLSDVIGEWEELLTKLDSALQTFKLE